MYVLQLSNLRLPGLPSFRLIRPTSLNPGFEIISKTPRYRLKRFSGLVSVDREINATQCGVQRKKSNTSE